jgi:hypothetical protein
MKDTQVQLEPESKETWEPMRLTPVGNLGAVMRGNTGSKSDAMTTMA